MSVDRLYHRRATIQPSGSAGSATGQAAIQTPFIGGSRLSSATGVTGSGYAGILRGLAIDYGSGVPATTDILIKDGQNGNTLFTRSNSATDLALRPLGRPGVDEANGALAATDGASGGMPFRQGIFIDVAQADPFVDDTDVIIVDTIIEACRFLRVDLYPVGADGSAVVVRTVPLPFAGAIRAIAVDYQNQPATTDLVIKANDSAGATLFTATNTATDIGPSPLGDPLAVDEGGAAVAATDGTDGGSFFTRGLYFDVAQGDGQTSGDERIVVDLWLDS